MTSDPHQSSWDAPRGEQPVEPSAGPSQPRVSGQLPPHPDTGGWAQPSWPAQQPAPPVPPVPGYGPQPQPPSGYGYGGHPGYGPSPQVPGHPGYGPVPHAPKPPPPTSAIVLVVLSGLLTLVLSWTLVGLLYAVPGVLSVVALTRSGSDPVGARRTSRTGWIAFGAVTVLLGLLVVLGAFLLAGFGGGGGTGGGQGVSV